MSERRYTDEEIAAIFRTASEGLETPRQQPAREQGLALVDLQAIGREVGIPADAIAQAALSLDVRDASSQNTLLGLPIQVARTVDLNRRLTDEEWERLVVRLREVFNARGTLRTDGSLRQWTNGNLQVLLEPTATGDRLRFRTFNAAARASIGGGFAAFGAMVAVSIATALSGTVAQALPGIALLAVAGSGLIVNGAIRLPRWARLRGRQMETLAVEAARPAAFADPSAPRQPQG